VLFRSRSEEGEGSGFGHPSPSVRTSMFYDYPTSKVEVL
jgi:hypothetical protein